MEQIMSKAALEACTEPVEVHAGFWKITSKVYDDFYAVGRNVEDVIDNYQRKVKITLAKMAVIKRREENRRESAERRKNVR